MARKKGSASLSSAQVEWVRKVLQPREELTQKKVADKLGVTQATISNILRGKTYKNVA
jgi:plasmid maintenance system antidote protein VapI